MWVQSLVGELTSHMPHRMAKNIKKKYNKKKRRKRGKNEFLTLLLSATKYEQVERSQSGKDVSEAAPQRLRVF